MLVASIFTILTFKQTKVQRGRQNHGKTLRQKIYKIQDVKAVDKLARHSLCMGTLPRCHLVHTTANAKTGNTRGAAGQESSYSQKVSSQNASLVR